MRLFSATLVVVLGLISTCSHAEESLHNIQKRWAEINYSTHDSDEKVEALLLLSRDAEALTGQHPDTADYAVWLGIVQSTTAGAEGGLGALKYAKAAKKSFEKAIKMDASALQGSALTSLGVLYHKVPGWPISFGSDKKARTLLTKALTFNEDGIDTNYFYAEFLFDEGEYQQAMAYLQKAETAPPRPDRPIADKGRHNEIQMLKDKLQAKLSH